MVLFQERENSEYLAVTWEVLLQKADGETE